MPLELRRFKAEILQALAHPTRIAIIETLRDGEHSAGHLIDILELEPANASQHFAVLRNKLIVTNRKEGNQVFYSLRDRDILKIFDVLKKYSQNQLAETKELLEEVAS
jgi:ArsR family transcriptional regulator